MEKINKHIGMPLEEFIEKNEKLAHYVAKRFITCAIEYEDAVQLALVGMIKAYRKYDPSEFKAQFSTYAVPMMRGEILRFLRDHDTSIKYPRVYKDIWSKVARLDLSEEPYEVIAEKTGYELRFIEKAMPQFNKFHTVSSNKAIASDENGKEVTLEEKFETCDDLTSVTVEEFKKTLTPKKVKVLELRMDEGLTQLEISKIVGVTQVQVSRILKEIGKNFKEFAEMV